MWEQGSLLGLSTSRSRSGLCPTRNRLVGIGWQRNAPAADCQSNRIGGIRPSTGGGRVGRGRESRKRRKPAWKRWK